MFLRTYKKNAAGRDGPIIQMWPPATPTPDLAASTFGLEDGNLIISWPTAAGQTYQVQRSMDRDRGNDPWNRGRAGSGSYSVS